MFRSPEREAFLRAALRSLRPGRARDALERELRGHMDDAAEAYRAQGLPPEEAEARAVASMGDPKALARQIRQAHRPAAPVGALALAGAAGQTALRGPDELPSRLLALALGGALGAAALRLDARRAARWAVPLLGGLLLAIGALAAWTPRVNGSYPSVQALSALLAPGLGLLAGRLRLRRGGAVLLGAAAAGVMALCAALGARGRRAALRIGAGGRGAGARAARRVARGAGRCLGGCGGAGPGRRAGRGPPVRQRLGPGAGAPLRQEFRARPARGRSLCRGKNGPVGRLPAGAPDRAMGLVGVAGAAGAAAGPGPAPVPDGPARPGPGGRGGCGGLRGGAPGPDGGLRPGEPGLDGDGAEPAAPTAHGPGLRGRPRGGLRGARGGRAAAPLRRAGKGGMLFPCAGLRRAGRRERA